jgi:hypothetical protein
VSNDEKAFKLIEAITSLDGVVGSEVYRKSTGENVYDILVKTENGRLIEGTLASKGDLDLFHKYLSTVLDLGNSNLRSYPNIDEGFGE